AVGWQQQPDGIIFVVGGYTKPIHRRVSGHVERVPTGQLVRIGLGRRPADGSGNYSNIAGAWYSQLQPGCARTYTRPQQSGEREHLRPVSDERAGRGSEAGGHHQSHLREGRLDAATISDHLDCSWSQLSDGGDLSADPRRRLVQRYSNSDAASGA